MNLCIDDRELFMSKVRKGVHELIDLNKIEELDEFDAGLYITNVFERTFRDMFADKVLKESDMKSLRTLLWGSVYTNLEIEKYEKYILDMINKK